LDVRRVNRITSMLLEEMRTLTDEARDLPIRWNIMHMYSSSQLAKVLVLRRGMGEQVAELAAIAAALHDIAVVATKKHDRHAEVAGEYVRDAIAKYNNGPWTHLPKVTKEEEDMLVKAIVRHSEKDVYTSDPLTELLKDVDSLDRYLHGAKTEGAYLERCNRVMAELGIKR
jgi:uncharacterized protein